MYFLSISFRNLWRRPVRSCLTAMGVAVAVATLIALVGTSQGVERAWSESMAGRGIHMLGFRKDTVEILSSTINQAVVEQIGRIAGIKAAAGELGDLVKLDAGVMGISGWPADSFLWETLQIQKGRRPGAAKARTAPGAATPRDARPTGLWPGRDPPGRATRLWTRATTRCAPPGSPPRPAAGGARRGGRG